MASPHIVVRPPLQQSGGGSFFPGAVEGALLYYDGSEWTGFDPSVNPGDLLTSQGPGAPPLWQSAAGGGYLTTATLWSNDLGGMGSAPSVERVQGVSPGSLGLSILGASGASAAEDLLLYRSGSWTTFTAGANGTLLGYTAGQLTAQSIASWGLQPLNANLTAISNGTWAGSTSIVTVGTVTTGTWNASTVGTAYGGTNAITPAGARDNILWASAAAIDPASPYSVAAGINNVTFSSSKTLSPRALSNYADGQTIIVTNSSASSIVVTITPADGTIDGAASVALTVLAHGVVGCQRTSSTTWVSLQPNALTPCGARGYAVGGVPYMVPVALINGTLVDVGASVAASATADPSAFGCTWGGADLTVPAGANVASSLQSGGQYWSWNFSALGCVLPTTPFRARTQVAVTGFTEGARAGLQHVALGLGSGPTTLAKALGIMRPSSGTSWSYSFTSTSGTPANVTGNSTTREIRGSLLCNATTSVGFAAERYSASSAIEATNDLTAGAGLAATPTSVTLYAYRQTAASTTDWVLNGLTWYVTWSGL